MDELLKKMLARRDPSPSTPSEPPTEGLVNPPIDTFTEQIAYHWDRYDKVKRLAERPALRPEASVLRSIKTWMKKVPHMDTKRVSVGKMRTSHGFMMNFGGKLGESDLIITPHKGQPFERQIHVEVKRPDVIVDGKKVQRAGKQSDNQVKYQQEMEARGDAYVVVTSVAELRDFLVSLGFTDLPKVPKGR